MRAAAFAAAEASPSFGISTVLKLTVPQHIEYLYGTGTRQ
jgi:hypothetical protein